MLAKIALIDPELTCDLPPAITARTGMDALTQLIEPFVCLRANPMTDGLCVEGLCRAARSLRIAFHDGQNKSARDDMALASLFGGLALANAGLGAVHGFAGPIGGRFPDAPHGAICAALLPHMMKANIRALRRSDGQSPALKRYDQIARICTAHAHATADAGVDWVRRLIDELQIPRLGTYGVKLEHVDELVRNATQSNSMKANPITLALEELAETLREAL
jgi:alcohol dehydrogenase class IV